MSPKHLLPVAGIQDSFARPLLGQKTGGKRIASGIAVWQNSHSDWRRPRPLTISVKCQDLTPFPTISYFVVPAQPPGGQSQHAAPLRGVLAKRHVPRVPGRHLNRTCQRTGNRRRPIPHPRGILAAFRQAARGKTGPANPRGSVARLSFVDFDAAVGEAFG